MSSSLTNIGAAMAVYDGWTSSNEIFGWVGPRSDPEHRIGISIRVDNNEIAVAEEIRDGIINATESQTYRELVASYGAGSIQIVIDSTETGVSGQIGFGSNHVISIAVRDLAESYYGIDGQIYSFTAQHAIVHEIVHALTGLNDDDLEFQDLVNSILEELQLRGHTQFGGPRDGYTFIEDPQCFSDDTLVRLEHGDQKAIIDICVGDTVLAYDPAADMGRGALVPRRVVRLYRNATEEWIKLTWAEGGETKELITTPGHHFLDRFGHFPTIEKMIEAGRATVVLASGELTEVTAERIVYSANTAHLFEQAQVQGVGAGNAALKPAAIDAWQTYNIEVEDLHTYIAGGVRVHNQSGNLYVGADGRLKYNDHTDDRNDGIDWARFQARYSEYGNPDGAVKMPNGGGFSFGVVNPLTGEVTAWQPGGDMDGDGDIDKVDKSLHDIDLYERHAAIARANGDDNSARNFERLAEEERRQADAEKAASQSSGQGNSDGSHEKGYNDNPLGSNSKVDVSNPSPQQDLSGKTLKPILLDLDGSGLSVTELSQSTTFVDGGDGLGHRTAWAGAGDGVLFFDADGDGTLSEQREYVFSEWDPTATSDLEALASVFDTNGDGKLTAADDGWSQFKVMVTNADGTTSVLSLDDLGITEIDLTGDATNIELPDGSIITGRTTFTMNGQTHTVGEMTLANDGRGYRVEDVESTDGSGNTVRDISGYGAGGDLAWAIHVVAAPDGSNTVNSYDDNGDGVTDRVQTITVTTGGSGETIRTVTNFTGSDAATGVLENRTVTTLSADGLTETIQQDSVGGGWFDQEEVRVTDAAGAMTITTTDLSSDGSTVRSSVETVSADGLTRTEVIDRDGDGDTDLTITHAITINPDGSRTEVITTENGDGSTRSVVTETVSADGRTKTIARDLDGDGDTDTLEELDITVGTSGSTSTLDVRNQDGSLRSSVTETLSDDALTSTRVADVDGDGIVDVTTVDETVINADGSRVHTVTATNTDGSIRGLQMETMSGDALERETWIDLDQDGVIEASELVQSVTVDGATGERIATVWDRNSDGSVNATTTSVTSADGRSSVTETDADNDGAADTEVAQTDTVDGAGNAVTVTTTRNQDGSLRGSVEQTSSADGLTRTTRTDLDGDGAVDRQTVDARVNDPDGSTLRTVSDYNGDGTNLLSQTQIEQSADRRTRIVREDSDGDGDWDAVTTTTEAADGSVTSVANHYTPDGTLSSSATTSISADGLVSETDTDIDGDGVIDRTTRTGTVLGNDGSQTSTGTVENGNGSLRSRSVTTLSDDGLTTTVERDADGNGVFEREVAAVTTLNADGSRTTREETRSADASLLYATEVSVSDDALSTTVGDDRDGDGTVDFTAETVTALQNDGGTTTTTELRDASGGLRSRETVTASDDGRYVLTETDINGDGLADFTTTMTIADNGDTVIVEEVLADDGTVQSTTGATSAGNGLHSVTGFDRDGDGIFEDSIDKARSLLADGSVETVTSGVAADGSIFTQSVRTVSDDGLTTTLVEDFDNDGSIDRETLSTLDFGADGSATMTATITARDGSVIDQRVVATSADRHTVTETVDWTDDGLTDWSRTTVEAEDGSLTRTDRYFGATGALAAAFQTVVSDDGLLTTVSRDYDGDGTDDYLSVDSTAIAQDGSVTRDIRYEDGTGGLVARETRYSSDDGLITRSDLDLDGDGTYELQSESVIAYLADGTTTVTETTEDAQANTRAVIESSVSGNGLNRSTTWDFTGDGVAERTWTYAELADRTHSETTREFNSDGSLAEMHYTWTSSTGRFISTYSDLDGDGSNDRRVIQREDLSQNHIVTYGDLEADTPTNLVIVGTSANSLVTTTSFDLGGDDLDFGYSAAYLTGDYAGAGPEFVWTETTSYSAAGAEITEIEQTYSTGRTGYSEVRTTEADGLSSQTTYDIDGDGVVDGRTTRTVTPEADGSRITTTETHYADGSLHSRTVVTESANGRETVATHDYDGNGLADKIVETVIDDDGRTIITETAFDEAGVQGEVFVTTISADGLQETILRNGITQTITYSPVQNGSYVWDDGETATSTNYHNVVEHVVDGLGIETWTLTRELGAGPFQSPQVETFTLRLDAVEKDALLAQAARLYDTILDRDMDVVEIEQLVQYAAGNRIDWSALATDLVESAEYSARYGSMSAAEFTIQTYLNTVGRAPSLDEMDEALGSMSSTADRVALALELAESSEHLVMGNGHRATNNFDVVMNPAQFERSLDEAYVRHLVTNMVDIAYDRAPTEHELDYLSSLLLDGTDTVADVAALLISGRNDLQGEPDAQLYQLTGTDLVNQAFQNAFGRAPTQAEEAIWTGHLSSGTLTSAEFVALLAQSVEHQAAGNVTTSTAIPNVNEITATGQETIVEGTFFQDRITGSSAADEIAAGAGSDVIIGGLGDDLLRGQAGSDRYIWALGDGNDTINDESNSLLATDVLELTNVSSSDIQLSQSGNDLIVTILSTDETITVHNRLEGDGLGKGVELIELADGVTILVGNGSSASTQIFATDNADTIDGWEASDTIHGGAGDDVLNGRNGDDTVYGGDGADLLYGSAGNDFLDGGTGDDTLGGGDGADTLDGGDGDGDLANFTASDAGVRVNLETGTGEFGHAEGDVLRNIEHVYGSAYADTLTGDSGRNQLSGGSGSDVLYGKAGRDTLYGGAGDDFLGGGWGNDILYGDAGNDTIQGSHGADWMEGGPGSDTYRFLTGDGRDTISRFDLTEDTIEIDGVAIDFANLPAGVSIERGTGVERLLYGDGDSIVIEGLFAVDGTSGNDTIDSAYMDPSGAVLNDFGQTINGGDGDDVIHSGSGDDTVYGGAGRDTVYASAGADHYDLGGDSKDRLSYENATSGVTVYLVDPSNNAGFAEGHTYSGIDHLVGSGFDDLLIAGSATNIFGGNGNDTLEDGSGMTYFRGDGGADVFRLHATGGTTGRIWDFDRAEGDRIDVSAWGVTSFSELTITVLSSTRLLVSDGTNSVQVDGYGDPGALQASDFLYVPDQYVGGTSGNDTIDSTYVDPAGAMLNDFDQTIDGGAGDDAIYSTAGNDTIYGGTGRDTLYASDGVDHFDGGDDNDFVVYQYATSGLVIDMTDPANSTGEAQGDSFANVERLKGSNYDDEIYLADGVYGYGLDGNDTIHDGGGQESLYGNAGQDVFVFGAGDGQRDQVNDFTRGEDLIDLSAWGVSDFSQLTITTVTLSNPDEVHVDIAFGSEVLRLFKYDAADVANLSAADFILAEAPASAPDLYGTAAADTIDDTFVDANGNTLSPLDQIIYAGDGDDVIKDGEGNNTVYGGGGRDTFYASDGADSYIGGDDIDTVRYREIATGLTIDMNNPSNSTGAAAGDTFTEIEKVQGTNSGDVIYLAAGVTGEGWGGNDVIHDSTGAESMSGGAGADTFVFMAGDGQRDQITYFEEGIDVIDLSAWGATSFDDLTITTVALSDGTHAHVDISYNGEELRLHKLTLDDAANIDAGEFIYA